MKQVSVVRFARRKIATTVLGTMVATAAVQGIAYAGQQAREVSVSTLGGPNRFSGPMRGVEDLRAMATTNRTQISSVLGQAGIGDISTQVLNVLTTGYISDTTVAPGTRFDWMALKRSGRPGVLRNVRWTGRQPFDAFQFSVEAGGYNYTFVVPKVCGNFALLSRTASPVAVAPPPAPAPEPPPPPRAPDPVPEPPPVAQAPPPPPAVIVVEEETGRRWVASGFIGTSFGTDGNDPLLQNRLPDGDRVGDGGTTFGFQIAGMKGAVGGEFIAEFAPVFQIGSPILAAQPAVNSYMFNLIAGLPFGFRAWQPYVSGGIGAMQMSTILIGFANEEIGSVFTEHSQVTKFGWDVGGGIFAFANKWGVRTDIRYYKAAATDTLELPTGNLADTFTTTLLSGLSYWRGNVGVAFRW